MQLPFSDRTLTFLKRAGLAAWLAAVIAVIVIKARDMDWPAVFDAVRGFEPLTVAVGFAFAVPACLVAASFDLVGRNATGHKLPIPRVMAISYTGYFFSLNLGALVGGLAFRYRLYMPYELPAMKISQVIGLSIVTNWSGYVLIAGGVLAFRPPRLPDDWAVSTALMRGTGFVLLAVAAAYLALCAIRGGSKVRWKGSELQLPTIGIAAVQIALSIASWGSIGAIIAWLLPGDVSWFAVMPVLMISALAGIWSHIPGGLGVIEVVFLALLGHRVPESQLLAAILVYRLIYYLTPFAFAVLAYAYLESTAERVGKA